MKGFQRPIRTLAWSSLIFVHLVIIAGSVVRMTGSGMGCPDWPKCFGYTIPPTNQDQVTWKPDRSFEKGQMIVQEVGGEDKLLVAQSAFTTGEEFDQSNWKPYEKHSYSIFNPTHTWIEFINRLIGALTGIPVLLLLAFSLLHAFRTKSWVPFLLSGGVLFMLGFEAWLGKLVVDGNLIPGSITIHMFGSIVLVFLLLILIRRNQEGKQNLLKADYSLLVAGLVLVLVQILLGTQVREEVDVIAKSGLDRSLWVEQLPNIFLIHRSFSWVLLLLIGGWLFRVYKQKIHFKEWKWIAGLLLLQLTGGIVLGNLGMPAYMQPVHLFGGIVMFGLLWSALLRSKRTA